MLLKDYIPDIEKLRSYIVDGIVTRRPHASLPLDIYCYGKRATYDNIWDDVTCKTRGLIVVQNSPRWENGEILSRPFEKFFNYNTEQFPETMATSLAHEYVRPKFFEKLDGSLGTLYQYGGLTGIATKGSFHSEHAEWATALYNSRRNPGLHVWPDGFTPQFELICEGVQHHVVHYGEDKIVLLALINTETGIELPYEQLCMWAWTNGIEVVEQHDINWYGALVDRPNTEGYVVLYDRPFGPPLRVKVKHQEFLRLQKIHHYTTPKTIFKALREGDGQSIADALRADEHLATLVDNWLFTFNRAYGNAFVEASNIVAEALTKCTTRKEFAAYFLQPDNKPFSAVCFKIIDQADSTQAIWDFVENTGIIQQQKYDEIEEE